MRERLITVTRRLTDDIRPVMDDLVADPELGQGMRRDIGALRDAFFELAELAQNPQGTIARFLTNTRRSRERFKEELQRLQLALGIDLDD